MKLCCTDLLIRIFARHNTREPYEVEATIEDGTFFAGTLRLDMAVLRAAALSPSAYGAILCEALFAGPIGRAYERAVGAARVQSAGRVRVRLWLDDAAPELHAIVWERLYHYHNLDRIPLSITAETPFSRYLGLGEPVAGPLRQPAQLLFALANPSDAPEYGLALLDVAIQIQALTTALAGLDQLHVTLLPGRTPLPADLVAGLDLQRFTLVEAPCTLGQVLRLAHTHQIIHMLGHGRFCGEGSEAGAALLLEDDAGAARWVRAAEIIQPICAEEPKPHLIVLSACHSATTSLETTAMGLAPQLVHAGIPAVVAMQDLIGVEQARRFTGEFYRGLLVHGLVDQAMNDARRAVANDSGAGWDVPVLYMRLEGGRLFAPDPLGETLAALREASQFTLFRDSTYVPLPIQVIRVSGLSARPQTGDRPYIGIAQLVMTAVQEVFERAGDSPQLVVLLGNTGANKSTQLRRLIWETIDAGPAPGRKSVLPIYVSLDSAQPLQNDSSVEGWVQGQLKQIWPEAPAALLEDAAQCPRLLIAFDRLDSLSEQIRERFWHGLVELIQRYPSHRYIIAAQPEMFLSEGQVHEVLFARSPVIKITAPEAFQLAAQEIDLQLMFIRPLSNRAVRQALRSLDCGQSSDLGRKLLDHVEKRHLLDLMSTPSLLIATIRRARRGIFPVSRVQIMEDRLALALEAIPGRQGIRARAAPTLYQLAWQMHSTHAVTWPIARAFATMEASRCQRAYNLEDFYDCMVKGGLLARAGDERVCFVSQPLQAYCCALALYGMAERELVLADITASLGLITRLRWWQEPLVYLCGLMGKAGQRQALGQLLHQILYGAQLRESEQIFLAARCMAEIEDLSIAHTLRLRVREALLWNLYPASMQRSSRRQRAAEALGFLRDPATIPELVRSASKKTRGSPGGPAQYEFSGVRMAAASALLQMLPGELARIEAEDPHLAVLLQCWRGEQVGQLIDLLRGHNGQPLAAFALGELQTPEALQALFDLFTRPAGVSDDVLWAVTDALQLIDPELVIQRAIRPLLSSGSGAMPGGGDTAQECLVYLIGKTQADTSEAINYLKDRLSDRACPRLQARVIGALGDIYDYGSRDCFERLAMGDLSVIAGADLDPADRVALRRAAIKALANIGDEETVQALSFGGAEWDEELDRELYHTCEEIAWWTGRRAIG